MKAVLTINCPSKFEPELSHLMHSGEPYLLRNCYVCWFYCGETEKNIRCSYPSLSLKKIPWFELEWGGDGEFEDEAIELPNSLLKES